jgi:Zn-dependent metalloprotease
VNVPSGGSWTCPNSAWVSGNGVKQFLACNGMATLDILAHEYTHAVTENTANLQYVAQSGSINESLSDIFASVIDGNWTLGEGSFTDVVRSMDDPTLPHNI